MSEKLAERVRNLKALSRGVAGDKTGGQSNRYTEALRTLWGKEPVKAAAQAAEHLALDPDGENRFAAYRLWIEALADAGDRPSLEALRDHLFLRGQAEPDDHEIYAALRGLAHFELDEFAAARLLARSFEGAWHNPYGLELVQVVTERVSETVADELALAGSAVPLEDYLQWQTLARGLLRCGAEDALRETLEHVRSMYRGAPLPHIYEYHRCIDAGLYAGAALVSERLTELYPQSVDYRYYYAYALYEDGDYPSARRVLNETVPMTGENDAEVVGLLGHCHAKLGSPDRAAYFLRKAVALLEAQGLPSSHVSLELANVEEELEGDQQDAAIQMPRVTRNWLIKLSPRRYHELSVSSDSAIDRLLRPMGAEPRPGDYCFFASSSPVDDGRALWRIAAIYAVESEPMWHPVHGYHTALKLVKRFPEGIPVDVETLEEGEETIESTELSREHPLRYGVYELDMGALTIIEEAARQHRDDMIERRRHAYSRRPTA